MTCSIPPGREYAVTHFLPIIPRPQWEKYLRQGKFQPGIQKGLDDTQECHVNRAVVVDGTVIDGVDIPGFFPWGWYRWEIPTPTPTLPPDPVEVTTRYERDPGAFGTSPLARQELMGLATELMDFSRPEQGCEIVPVPTIDQLVPFPARDIMQRFAEGNRLVPQGALGSFVLRLPGSTHALFSSGLALAGFDEQFLSPLGQELFAFWNQAREGWGAGMDHRNECGWYPVLPFSPSPVRGDYIALQWFARDFAASHMQCLSPNHFIGGTPVDWRWRHGGAQSAGYVGDGWDVYEERAPAGLAVSNSGFLSWYPPGPLYTQFTAENRPKMAQVEERIGPRDRWGPPRANGSRERTEMPWQGPPPGAFMLDMEAAAAAPWFGGGGGLRGLGRSSHDACRGNRCRTGGRALAGLGRSSHDACRGNRCSTGGRALAGFFSEVGEAFGDVWEGAKDVVESAIKTPLKWSREILGEVWQHLPKELRAVAIQIGPTVAGLYLPGFGKVAAEAALMILEGDRNADRARDALRRAQSSGAIPQWIDLSNANDLAALHAAAQAPSRPAAVSARTTESEAVRGLATTGGALLALTLL